MRRLTVLLELILNGCASMVSFNPQPGMSYDEWKRTAARSFRGLPELVAMKGNTSVYHLPNSDENRVPMCGSTPAGCHGCGPIQAARSLFFSSNGHQNDRVINAECHA
jgi:hypothetical protein